MRTCWVFRVVLLLGLVMPSAAASQPPPLPPVEPEYASVSVNPSYQEAAPGAQLAFTVYGSSTLGGTVSVIVGAGLDLIGDPICSGPCRGPFITSMSDATIVEVTLDGDNATIGFNATVSPSARTGDTLNINVILVGGPQAVEMASATIYVTGSIPTQAPSAIEDNRMVFLGISPLVLRLTPGGNVLYHIQSGLWGMWSDQDPNIELEIHVPAGLAASSEPYCGIGDLIPMQDPCAAMKSEGTDGSKTYSINPGYSPIDDSANGVYLVLRANSDLEIGSSLQVSVSATVDDDTLAEQPQPISSTIQVVSKESLLTPRTMTNTVGAILEATQGFTKSGLTCSTAPSSSQIGLYEYGLETRFSTATVVTGRIGVAGDGSGTEVCLMPIMFSNVPPRDLYVLATSYGDDFPCRACVYGLITASQDGEAVFPSQQ